MNEWTEEATLAVGDTTWELMQSLKAGDWVMGEFYLLYLKWSQHLWSKMAERLEEKGEKVEEKPEEKGNKMVERPEENGNKMVERPEEKGNKMVERERERRRGEDMNIEEGS